MQVIIHCGTLFGGPESDPQGAGSMRCAAPANHSGAHTDDYWEWIYEARKRVINEWKEVLLRRRVPTALIARLLILVSDHYSEPKEEPKQAPPSYNSRFDFYAEAMRQTQKAGAPWQQQYSDPDALAEFMRQVEEAMRHNKI